MSDNKELLDKAYLDYNLYKNEIITKLSTILRYNEIGKTQKKWIEQAIKFIEDSKL